jgi:hypothetical protein
MPIAELSANCFSGRWLAGVSKLKPSHLFAAAYQYHPTEIGFEGHTSEGRCFFFERFRFRVLHKISGVTQRPINKSADSLLQLQVFDDLVGAGSQASDLGREDFLFRRRRLCSATLQNRHFDFAMTAATKFSLTFTGGHEQKTPNKNGLSFKS